jgi:hypothetical protein
MAILGSGETGADDAGAARELAVSSSSLPSLTSESCNASRRCRYLIHFLHFLSAKFHVCVICFQFVSKTISPHAADSFLSPSFQIPIPLEHMEQRQKQNMTLSTNARRIESSPCSPERDDTCCLRSHTLPGVPFAISAPRRKYSEYDSMKQHNLSRMINAAASIVACRLRSVSYLTSVNCFFASSRLCSA